MAATYDAANSFNTRLRDTILSLVREVREARDGVEAIKDDQQGQAKKQEELQAASEKENNARRAEIVALEDRLWKEKKLREEELGKLAEKQERDKDEVKEKLKELDTWVNGEVDGMKKELEEMSDSLNKETKANREQTLALEKALNEESEERKSDIAEVKKQHDLIFKKREEDKAEILGKLEKTEQDHKRSLDILDAKICDLEEANSDKLEEIKMKMEKENKFLKKLAAGTTRVYFDAYR